MKATVSKYKDASRPHLKWRVWFNDAEGRRRDEKFRTKDEAEGKRDQLNLESERTGIQARDLTDVQRLEAAKCFKLLPKGSTLTQAVEELVIRHQKKSETVPVSEAVADLIDNRKKLQISAKKSPRYVLELKSQLRPFVEAFGVRPIRELEADEIAAWIQGRSQSAVSRNNARCSVSTLFSHAIKRKWAAENPTKEIDAEDIDSPPAGVLTPGAMRALLSIAQARYPSLLVPLAIQGFAGLRDAEVRRLSWTDISFEDGHITVSAMNAKTRTRRTIDIAENLKRFLLLSVKHDGRLTKSCHRMHFAELRKEVISAGFDWPTNALRHSYVSYRLTATGDSARTALEAGHTESMLHQHYKNLVSKRDAAVWWTISPDAIEGAANVIPMPVEQCASVRSL